jgi:hypothetical protein
MMTPFQNLLQTDIQLVLEDLYGPAEEIILVDPSGTEHPLRALYEAPGVEVTPGQAHAATASTAPLLHVPIAAVKQALGRRLSRRDAVIARGKLYRPEFPRPDGYGMLAVKLLEKGDG